MVRGAAAIEIAGVPTVTYVSPAFRGVAENAYGGMGFAELAMTMISQDMVSGITKDVRPDLVATIQDTIVNVTSWEPKIKEKKIIAPARFIHVTGRDYSHAVDKMNELMLKNRWGDGLPVVPATKEKVEWMLRGTDDSPDRVIGKMDPRGGIVTVETVAIAAVMAGARPEYMPVLLAAVEAMLKPEYLLAQMAATTNPVAPVVIVNGPIAEQIGLNSGAGLLGPNPQFPAGASIGRSLRLLMQNVGGAIAGVTNMSTQGQPGRYTGLVFAEAEDFSPWPPLNTQWGFQEGTNSVFVYATSGTANLRGTITTNEKWAKLALAVIVSSVGFPNTIVWTRPEGIIPGIVILTPASARGFAKLGWTKEKIQMYLYENARVPRSFFKFWRPSFKEAPWIKSDFEGEGSIRITDSPDKFPIVVGGTKNIPYHGTWLPAGRGGVPTVAEIKLPQKWETLLKESEK